MLLWLSSMAACAAASFLQSMLAIDNHFMTHVVL